MRETGERKRKWRAGRERIDDGETMRERCGRDIVTKGR